MIEFGIVVVQTYHRVAQTLAVCHLSERHAQKLLPTAEVPDATGSAVPVDTTVELVMVDKCHDLRKNVFAFVHIDFPDSKESDKSRTISNRLTQKWP